MKNSAARVYFSHHLKRILEIVRLAEQMVAHASARGECHLAILHVKARCRKAI